jgi:C4-dicarboxylate-specific signal transduction histidine kinase
VTDSAPGRAPVDRIRDRQSNDRRKTDHALRRAQAELAHTTRLAAMGELVASMAHELNQPLAAVAANGEAAMRWLAREMPNIDEATQAMKRVVRDANRASELIAHVRSLLKKSETRKETIDLAQTIEGVLIAIDLELEKHRIVVHKFLAHDLPRVVGSKIELQQVVLNLLLNAIEAMATAWDRPRELTIRCSEREASDGKGIVVSVQDSGVGLPTQSVDQLFESFYTTKFGGLGMGLSISRSIVEAHGGVLAAERNEGHGATFEFVLPTCSEDPRAQCR